MIANSNRAREIEFRARRSGPLVPQSLRSRPAQRPLRHSTQDPRHSTLRPLRSPPLVAPCYRTSLATRPNPLGRYCRYRCHRRHSTASLPSYLVIYATQCNRPRQPRCSGCNHPAVPAGSNHLRTAPRQSHHRRRCSSRDDDLAVALHDHSTSMVINAPNAVVRRPSPSNDVSARRSRCIAPRRSQC